MIILENKKYIRSSFKDEAEIEKVVIENYEFLFGPNSILLEKSLIKTSDGVGTIPDAFAIDFETKKWYLVEAELIAHNVWNHISPQVAKQIIAANEQSTKKKIEELVIKKIQYDKSAREKITELGIKEIDFRKHISDILNTIPIVGIPIDGISNDLRNWASTFKNPVKLWIITKYSDIQNREIIAYEFPEEFRPEFDTSETEEDVTQIVNGDEIKKINRRDITILDLINSKILVVGQKLISTYKPRTGNQIRVEASVLEDGSIQIGNDNYKSPSYAALSVLQKAGSDRETVNGWTSWKTEDGKYISELRKRI